MFGFPASALLGANVASFLDVFEDVRDQGGQEGVELVLEKMMHK